MRACSPHVNFFYIKLSKSRNLNINVHINLYYEKSPKIGEGEDLTGNHTLAASLLRPTTLLSSPVSQHAESDVVEVFLHHAVESPELYINTGVMIHRPVPAQEGVEDEARTALLLRKESH